MPICVSKPVTAINTHETKDNLENTFSDCEIILQIQKVMLRLNNQLKHKDKHFKKKKQGMINVQNKGKCFHRCPMKLNE